MHEVAMVFDKDGNAIHWSSGRSAAVPDSRTMWDIIWENRHKIGGVAHTHPWDGPTGPSGTDVTTWAAIEAGLGKRLLWPIVTMTHVHLFYYDEEQKRYVEPPPPPPLLQKAMDLGYFPMKIEWEQNIKQLRDMSANDFKAHAEQTT